MGYYDGEYNNNSIKLLASLTVQAINKGIAIQKAVERAVKNSGNSFNNSDIEYIKAIEII